MSEEERTEEETQRAVEQEQESAATNSGGGNTTNTGGNSECDCSKQIEKAVKSYQRLLSKRDTTIKELKDQIAELNGEVAEAQTRVASLSEYEARVKELEAELQKREKDLRRKKFIMEKFPNLAEFEALGTLPDADDENELVEKLQRFQKLIEGRRAPNMAGAFPDTNQETSHDGISPDLSEAQLMTLAEKARKEGDMAKFNKVMDLLTSKQ